MSKPSDLELKRNQLARLKANLDECAQRLITDLAVEDPHTQLLRAKTLAERLRLGSLIASGGDTTAVIKQLAQMPAIADVHAFRPAPDADLRVGRIGKTDEQRYAEFFAEFDAGLIELNKAEVEQGGEVSTAHSITARIEHAPRIGRPVMGQLELLDTGLSESYSAARLALARATINEESPRSMGRPARTVEEVNAEYNKRLSELDSAITALEAGLVGVEVHDRAAKLYRDSLALFKRLVKELGGADQIAAKGEVVRLEAHLKFLKTDRKRYVEAGEPSLPVDHYNSPGFHLLSARVELKAVRETYNAATLGKDIKRIRASESKKAKAKEARGS